MRTLKLKRKLKVFYLRRKYEVCEMSKKLIATTVLVGAMVSVAPMVGLADPTTESVQTELSVEQAEGYGEKAKAILSGAGAQLKGIFNKVTDVDERLAKKDAQLKQAMARIAELEANEEKTLFVRDLELQRAVNCVETIGTFFTEHVKGVK